MASSGSVCDMCGNSLPYCLSASNEKRMLTCTELLPCWPCTERRFRCGVGGPWESTDSKGLRSRMAPYSKGKRYWWFLHHRSCCSSDATVEYTAWRRLKSDTGVTEHVVGPVVMRTWTQSTWLHPSKMRISDVKRSEMSHSGAPMRP